MAAGTMPAPCTGPLRDSAGSSCPGTALLSRSRQEADGDDTGGRFLRQDALAFSTTVPVAEPAGPKGPSVHGHRCSGLQKPRATRWHRPAAALPLPGPAPCRLPWLHHSRCSMCQATLLNSQAALGCALPACQKPASCCLGAGAKPAQTRGRETSAAVLRLCPACCQGGGDDGRGRGRTRLHLEGSSPLDRAPEPQAGRSAEPSRSSASRDAAAQQQPPPGRTARSYVRDGRLGVSTRHSPAIPCTTEVYLERTVSQ